MVQRNANFNKSEGGPIASKPVQMTLSRVIVEMVADGGGRFSPASYRWFTHMSLLFSSYSAHSRAEGSPIEHLSR